MTKAPVTYIPELISPLTADLFFRTLRDELPWVRRENPSGGFVPRAECYFNDIYVPYVYGKGEGARTYLPQTSLHPTVWAIRQILEVETGVDFDVCFLNLYETNRDYLGWHADDSPEMSDDHPIATVTLGSARAIQFRPKQLTNEQLLARDGSAVETLMLESGSAAIMAPGMQDHWQHRIPKDSNNQIGPRISLTFRVYVDPAEVSR